MTPHSRPASFVLPLLFAVATAAPAQTWIITEVHTGTPDFVEIQNVSGGPLSTSGLSLFTSNAAACPAVVPGVGAAQLNGAYAAAGAATVPDGGFFVFEELGVAGSPSLTTAPSPGGFPPGTLGERMGLNLTWAGGSHGEVALFQSGVAVDYVRFFTQPTTGTIPVADGYRYDPPGAGGRWLSEAFVRGAGTDAIFRVAGGGPGGLAETDSNADWNADVAHTGGAANAPGAAGVKTAGVDLELANLGGNLVITATTSDASLAGAQGFTLISLLPTTCANAGPVAGLSGDVWTLIFQPLGSEPFHVSLNASGDYAFLLPLGGTVGLAVEARFVVFVPPATLIFSNFVYAVV
jgi:hypothetical protein